MDTTPTPELALAEILARGVAVDWFEAVALVRATTDQLTRMSESRRTPDLGQILLKSDGSVRVSGTSYSDESVRRLGQLLQALLSRSDPPTTLRLVVANATAPVPIYADLPQFDQAAAYFERPDRPAVLRALFGRAASQTVAGSAASAVQSVDRVAPLPEEPQTDIPDSRQTARQVAVLALVGGLLVSAAYLGNTVYRERRLPAGTVIDAAQRATRSLTGAMLSGLSAVSERVGLGHLAPTSQPAPAPANPSPATVRLAPPHGRHRSTSSRGMIQAFDLDLIPGVSEAPPTMAAAPDKEPDLPSAGSGGETDAAVVYRDGSPGIVPPTAIRPKFPKILPAGVDPSDLSRIDVTIQPDGSVESVKLFPAAADSVEGIMLLSAAKAWRFAPATKDGVPVRYLKTIWVIAE